MPTKVELSNPDKLSLDKLFFNVKQDGIEVKIPALSESWIESRKYTKYKALPIDENKLEEDFLIDEWLSETGYFNEDLQFLLQLPHYKFWSNIVFEKQCMEAVVSFFQEATPCYINICKVTNNQKIISLYQEVLTNAFRVICRLITNKESDTEWITKDYMQQLLYSNFLISIPLIFDLIIAFGRSNHPKLSKAVQTIFKIEPRYADDLKLSLQYFEIALKTIQKKAETEQFGDEVSLGIRNLEDLALYTLDCTTTISILLEILPQAKEICADLKIEQMLTNFYENAIPLLYKNIYTINSESLSLYYLNKARMEILRSFKMIIYVNIEKILKNPSNSMQPAQKYIAILTECLSNRTFVVDFQNYFPVGADIDILNQACPELDHFEVDFVYKAYTSEGEAYLLEMLQNDVSRMDIQEKKSEFPESNIKKHELKEELGERNIENEILKIKEVFPEMGDGFIRRLLSRYDKPEQAIAAICESNLPPDLADADQNEVYIPPDPQDTLYMQTGIKRFNVFDGDEYDLLSRDDPNCIIKNKKGFPGQPKNLKQMLDDKSHVKEMKQRYLEYSLINDEDEYNDEYDDSYEALAESEVKVQKVGKDNLPDEIEASDDEEENYEIENVNSSQVNKEQRDTSRDFCENPEITRARYEAQRAAKYGRGGYKHQNPQRDVVGKAKGQGQDDKTLFNRHKKEVNKSSRGNHNRKSGASWKRSRGMVPF